MSDLVCCICGFKYIVNRKYKLCDKHNKERLREQSTVVKKPSLKVAKKRTNTNLEQDTEHQIRIQLWEQREHRCEECGRSLGDEPRPVFFSHILSKGAHPRLRCDKRNFNLLCFNCHRKWEDGTNDSRMRMNIWNKNEQTIKILLTHEIEGI